MGGVPAWSLVIIALAFLGALAFVFWRRRRQRIAAEEMSKKPAHVIAYEELSKIRAQDLPGKGLVKEYYFCLSDIVRRYLEGRFSYRAPEMTTEEFLNDIK